MRRHYFSLFCAAAISSASATADEFSWEITGSVRSSDVGGSTDADSAALSATFHFQPLDDSAGPYELAPFLSRTSRIGVGYSEDKTTAHIPVLIFGPSPTILPQPATVVDRADARSLSGRHVWRSSGWYAGGAFAEVDAADPAPLPANFSALGDELSTRALSVGKYVAERTAIELSLERVETSLTSTLPLFCSLLSCADLTLRMDTESDILGISARHVGALGRLTYSLSGGISSSEAHTTRIVDVVETPAFSPVLPPFFGPVPLPPYRVVGNFGLLEETLHTTSRSERYALTGELFPTAALGIRLSAARWDGAEALDKSYELAATWFFKRRVGARISLSRVSTGLPIDTVQDVDAVSLQFIGRL